MSTPTKEELWHGMRRATRTLVVVDVVESVRLMQANEADVIDRWRRFVDEVRTQVLPAHGGRLVKSLGDGLLLEFESVPPAVAAALEIQQRILPYNRCRSVDEMMCLRLGAHVADVVIDALDVYGAGVNLAARLATLAGPGEVVVSESIRAETLDLVDAEFVDLGECYLKHWDTAVRAWRIGAARGEEQLPAPEPIDRLTLAVLPFAATESVDSRLACVGEVIADDVAIALSHSRYWTVGSRLSAAAVARREFAAGDIARLLNVRHVISGVLRQIGDRLLLAVELIEGPQNRSLWSEQFEIRGAQAWDDSKRVSEAIVSSIGGVMLGMELQRVSSRALPTLQSYSVLLGSVAWMHRFAKAESLRAHQALDHLIERHPRSAEPHAWLGKWHMLQVAQGWSVDHATEVSMARASLSRALDLAPDHALALAIDGQMLAYEEGDLNGSELQLMRSIENNPSESLAWLFLSNLRANQGRGTSALEAARKAMAISPVDPMRFMYEIFGAYAALADDQYELALKWSESSVRANAMHIPSFPVLILAQALSGEWERARLSTRRFLQLRPQASVAAYARRLRAPAHRLALYADVLREAGVPP